MITVQEYAVERGCSRQAVYNALKKYKLETVQGVSNGKSTQYLTDETIAKLNEVIRPTNNEISNMNNSMSLAIADREIELLREKEKEMTETRSQFLLAVKNMSGDIDTRMAVLTQELIKEREDLKASYTRELTQIKQDLIKANEKIRDLDVELVAAYDTIKRQAAQIRQLEEHPFKEWNNRRKEQKNGKSKETN